MHWARSRNAIEELTELNCLELEFFLSFFFLGGGGGERGGRGGGGEGGTAGKK